METNGNSETSSGPKETPAVIDPRLRQQVETLSEPYLYTCKANGSRLSYQMVLGGSKINGTVQCSRLIKQIIGK
jgi:hypothetical protein